MLPASLSRLSHFLVLDSYNFILNQGLAQFDGPFCKLVGMNKPNFSEGPFGGKFPGNAF